MSNVTDSGSPLYIYLSDTLSSTLISEQLTGTENYGIWSHAMTVSLRAKNKLGFVDGSCEKSKFNESLYAQWERCNSLVLACIFNTVSKEIFNSIVYSTSAYQVWQDLQEQYNKINGTKVFGIHREVANLVQGTNTIVVYYNKLKTLWDELGSLVSLPPPDSESAKAYLAHLNQQKLL